MRKTATVIFLFLIIIFGNAQMRFVYQVTFKPIKSSNKTQTELMALEVIGNKSAWFSLNNFKIDSAFKKNNFDEIHKTNEAYLNHLVVKDWKKQSLSYTEKFNSYPFTYLQSPKIIWKLSNEKGSILRYQTQKASCDFGGRLWQAQFGTDLPINDGPYKFSGLPGLILKLESEDKDYVFELVAVQKIKNFSIEITTNHKNLSEKKVREFKQKFKENPSNYPINWTNKFKDVFEYSPTDSSPENKKSIEEQVAQALRKYDNPIEKGDVVLVW